MKNYHSSNLGELNYFSRAEQLGHLGINPSIQRRHEMRSWSDSSRYDIYIYSILKYYIYIVFVCIYMCVCYIYVTVYMWYIYVTYVICYTYDTYIYVYIYIIVKIIIIVYAMPCSMILCPVVYSLWCISIVAAPPIVPHATQPKNPQMARNTIFKTSNPNPFLRFHLCFCFED